MTANCAACPVIPFAAYIPCALPLPPAPEQIGSSSLHKSPLRSSSLQNKHRCKISIVAIVIVANVIVAQIMHKSSLQN